MENRILELAFAFAESKEQAHFINTCARSLKQGCKLGNLDMQLCRIADNLDENGKWFLSALSEFVQVKP